ncbi:hypothetical protein KFE25_007767 [Diacronema lutheri]|uniref:Uncharacterized protein n=1 Tax=Diacronema lutheri TaxID=2081491 RepID=A0A8J5Y0V1_DIALT|nr:hypothetical protein KFE25_007767 [Diacronema lutheri]
MALRDAEAADALRRPSANRLLCAFVVGVSVLLIPTAILATCTHSARTSAELRHLRDELQRATGQLESSNLIVRYGAEELDRTRQQLEQCEADKAALRGAAVPQLQRPEQQARVEAEGSAGSPAARSA